MIKIVAKRTVRPDEVSRYLELARELVEKSQAEEGNISYTLNQNLSDPRTFTFLEVWRDQAAIDSHNASEHFTRLVPMLGGLVETAFPVELYTEVQW